MRGFRVSPWMFAATFAVCTGCATARRETPTPVCPEPVKEEEGDYGHVADTIPLLRDEGLLCLIWRSNEENGRILRVVTRTKGGFNVQVKRLSDEERKEFRELAAEAIRHTPDFKGRTLWQICGQSGTKV